MANCIYCNMKVEEQSDGWGYNLILEMFHTECLQVYEDIKLTEEQQ